MRHTQNRYINNEINYNINYSKEKEKTTIETHYTVANNEDSYEDFLYSFILLF